MKLSTAQLNNYMGSNYTTAELTTAIENSGIELEAVYRPEPLNTKIIVGLTKKVVQHPNADKLRLVLVDVGAEHNLHIVCGAPNVTEDQYVVVATVGSILPDGTEIREARLRGELSQGMLCSEAELGLSDNHSGILVLDQEYRVGKSFCDIASSDDIVDTKSSANRSDLLSYEGIAREIAAQLDGSLNLPKVNEVQAPTGMKLVKKLPKYVPAYSTTLLELTGVGGDLTTQQLSVLRAAGVRPISMIVDITNYIMLTTGQPLHAFDADSVKLPLEVRYAAKGETLVTLDGKTRTLADEDLVIADGNGPVALAGVMGGLGSEVTGKTKRIILESATFSPLDVRKTAQRHGIRTDASARYERGLPVELADRGRSLAIEFLTNLGAKVVAGARLGALESPAVNIDVKPQRINDLLGIEVPPKQIIGLLSKLGFKVSGLAKLKVQAPWWRPDIKEDADVVEEVIKLVGLDSLPAKLPSWQPIAISFDTTRTATSKIRELLRAAGLFEVTTYSFVSEADLQRFNLLPAKHLKLKNPLSVEQAYMRSSLLPSLMRVVESNQRYAKSFGVSEISRVFMPRPKKGQLPIEEYRIAVAVMGDYYAAKSPLDLVARELDLSLEYRPSDNQNYHPGRQADIILNGVVIGSIGQLHPKHLEAIKGDRLVSYLEVRLADIVSAIDSRSFDPISKYPSISRDIAVVIDRSVLWSTVAEAVMAEVPYAKVSYQSRYEGTGIESGKVSLAWRMTLTNMERTMTDEEADAAVLQVMTMLEKKFLAKPRV